MNDLVVLRAKYDENVANLDGAKTSLADVSHELARAKHELGLAKDAPIVSDVLELAKQERNTGAKNMLTNLLKKRTC